MAELIIFLGWLLNTRAFMIALPKEKAKAWSESIRRLIDKICPIHYQELATLVGRINHVAYIIPQARHFINRIRKDEQLAKKHRTTKISKETKKDLTLWLKFINYASTGISINNIVFRKPTSISLSDACETRMGGYNPLTGKAWRHKFTEAEQIVFTLNTKEFIAAKISQQLALDEDTSPYPCHLNIGDSAVAEAWLYKSINHDPDSSPIQNAIAHTMAEDLIQRQASNYSQHLRGIDNMVADSLSRDTDLSDEQPISMLKAYSPPLLPANIQILPLSTQTTSWIASLTPLAPKTRELQWAHTPSTIAAGVSGWNSCPESHQTTPIFSASPKTRETPLSVCSWIQCTMENSRLNDSLPSRATLRDRPSIMYRRSYRQVVGSTQEKH
jgi:hypothetical protein